MRRFALTLVSAVLFPIALPSELFLYGNPFLGIFALSFYYVALVRTPTRREAIVHGIIFGALSTIIANYWLMYFGQFSVWTLGGVTLGYTGYNALLGPILWYFLRRRPTYRPFIFAIAWTAYEYLKSIGYLGYPWGLSAYPFNTIIPLVQQVDIAGIWTLCFLAVSANAVVGEVILARFFPPSGVSIGTSGPEGTIGPAGTDSPAGSGGRVGIVTRQALFVTALVLLSLGYGFWRLSVPIPIVKYFSAVLVQQNSDSWNQGNDIQTLETAERLSNSAVRRLGHTPDMVIWSETSLRYPFKQGRQFYENNPPSDPFISFVRKLHTFVLTGSPYIVDKNWDAMNATILLDPQAQMIGYYGKQHLVPFAESFPFWNVPFVRSFVQNAIGLQAVWISGNRYTIFQIPLAEGGTLKFGTPICFEDAFGYLARNFVLNGAQVLINLTNNSWSDTVSAQTQHFVAARFRAIENRRTLVRSTNSGLSTVVDAYGRRTNDMPMFKADSEAVKIPVYMEKQLTPYTLFGDYLPVLFLAFLLGILLRENLRALIRRR
jgi:apolipoprotein N-acyltransferase